MVADLLIAWLLEFCAIVGHLVLDAAVIVAGLGVAALIFIAVHEGVRRLGRLGKKLSSEEREWAEFAAAHHDADLITITEEAPDA